LDIDYDTTIFMKLDAEYSIGAAKNGSNEAL